jgi:hypothetical protein
LNGSTLILGAILLLVIVAGLIHYGRQMLQDRRRTNALRALLENADQLETDLMECRKRLHEAHAVMTATSGTPAHAETEAREAVDSGLRALLQHRLWIRDNVETASQQQLDEAVEALRQARRQMEPQLTALGDVQRDLDQAVRDRIEREKPA